MGDASLIHQEEQRFRASLEAYLRMRPGTTPPIALAAAADEVARRAERLSYLIRPAALRDGPPDVIIIPLAVYVPAHDPDRDVQILLTALDHCPINTAAQLLDRSRITIRGITALAYKSVEREASRLLGPWFNPPPRNPKRSKRTILDEI